jgi:hypothetical protein
MIEDIIHVADGCGVFRVTLVGELVEHRWVGIRARDQSYCRVRVGTRERPGHKGSCVVTGHDSPFFPK